MDLRTAQLREVNCLGIIVRSVINRYVVLLTEELDFIVNYRIKLRMGRESLAGEEAESEAAA
jgi:hypothetical protein